MQCHHWAAADGDHQRHHQHNFKQKQLRQAGINETTKHREMHELVRQALHPLQQNHSTKQHFFEALNLEP